MKLTKNSMKRQAKRKSIEPKIAIITNKSPIRKYITHIIKNSILLTIPSMTHPWFLVMSIPTIKYPIPKVIIKTNRECKKNRVGGYEVPNSSNIAGSIIDDNINENPIIQLKIAPIINRYL